MKKQFQTKCKQIHGTTRKVLLGENVYITIDHLEDVEIDLEKGKKYKITIESI